MGAGGIRRSPLCTCRARCAGRAVTPAAVDAGLVAVLNIVVTGEIETPGRVKAVVQLPARCGGDLVHVIVAISTDLDTVLGICRPPRAGEGQRLRRPGFQEGGIACPDIAVVDVQAGHRDPGGGGSLVPDRISDNIIAARGRALVEDVTDDEVGFRGNRCRDIHAGQVERIGIVGLVHLRYPVVMVGNNADGVGRARAGPVGVVLPELFLPGFARCKRIDTILDLENSFNEKPGLGERAVLFPLVLYLVPYLPGVICEGGRPVPADDKVRLLSRCRHDRAVPGYGQLVVGFVLLDQRVCIIDDNTDSVRRARADAAVPELPFPSGVTGC
ncbi:MAG: hypothetical protein A4E33_01779 [Methanoregula sp. PtaB.Bin085]|nr:MAG: hypothetical protein A4E33_01779 [Methanoregula sp. PtaB.Bin085]